MATEEKLIELAKEGSVAAFGKLVETYQNRLLRFLLPRCRSRADAEDALQDTFVNAYRYLGSYNPRWRFSTWLYRIAIRNASKIVDNNSGEQGISPADDSDPLEACIAASERENLWLTARRTLSADAYSAMWLRYVEDMPVKEVARTMEKPISWTKVTLMRSRQRLGRELACEAESSAKGEAYG